MIENLKYKGTFCFPNSHKIGQIIYYLPFSSKLIIFELINLRYGFPER